MRNRMLAIRPRGRGRIVIVLVAVVALALSLWLTLGQGGGPATAAGLSAKANEEKDEMVSSLTEGQILYMEMEVYAYNSMSFEGLPYPKHLIYKTWLEVGPDGGIGRGMTTISDLEEKLVAYAVVGENGGVVQTDVASRHQMEFQFGTEGSLAGWVEFLWSPATSWLNTKDYEYMKDGDLKGRDSAIYELEHTSNFNDPGELAKRYLKRVEYVKDKPVLFSQSVFDIGDDDQRTLLSSQTIVDIKVLPSGSGFPDPPDLGPEPFVPWPPESGIWWE